MTTSLLPLWHRGEWARVSTENERERFIFITVFLVCDRRGLALKMFRVG